MVKISGAENEWVVLPAFQDTTEHYPEQLSSDWEVRARNNYKNNYDHPHQFAVYPFRPKEMKEAIVAKLLEDDVTVMDVQRETGVGINTLYRWRDKALNEKGLSATTKYKNADKWSSQDKFTVVLETANLSEIEFSEYCREKGIYPEQVKEWKEACMNANDTEKAVKTKVGKELREERKKTERLEKELARKDKALAETAALLVLRKKANAIWGTEEEEE